MSKKSLASRILPKALQDDIDRQIEPHLRRRADGDGVCSTKTARERRGHILCTVASLWQMKYCIRKLESLDKRHIDALMARWDAEGKSAEFLHNRVSVLRILGLVGAKLRFATYKHLLLNGVQRSTVSGFGHWCRRHRGRDRLGITHQLRPAGNFAGLGLEPQERNVAPPCRDPNRSGRAEG